MYALREVSQQEFLKFMEEPQDSPRWKREGIYGSWTIGPPGDFIEFNSLARTLYTLYKDVDFLLTVALTPA